MEALYLVSDTHIGRRTATFNLEAAGQRLRAMSEKVVTILQKRFPEISKVTVALLGDIVEGEGVYPTQTHLLDFINPKHLQSVFPTLSQTTFLEPTTAGVILQTYLAASVILQDVILPLHQAGFEIAVETCVGNHGRLGKYLHPLSNADFACYLFLQEMCRRLSKVTVRVSGSEFHLCHIQEHPVLLCHGTGIPIYQRVPYYGAERRARDWHAIEVFGDRLAAVCLGHFHTAFFLPGPPPVLCNGTLVTDDLYPVRKLGNKGVNVFWLVVATKENPVSALWQITW